MMAMLFLFTYLTVVVEATVLMVQPTNEFCIWIQAMKGDIVGHRFEVYKKEQRDVVNLQIIGPNDRNVIKLSDTNGDQLSFRAEEEGPYTLCYDNKGKQTVTVAFRNVVGQSAAFKESVVKDTAVSGLDKHVEQLVENAMPVWDELEYYRKRMQYHLVLAELQLGTQTNFIIVKLVVTVVTSLVLVYYISSLFETKRRI